MNKQHIIMTLFRLAAALGVVVFSVFFGMFAYKKTRLDAESPVFAWSEEDEFSMDNINSFVLRDDGEFKILQLTDLHFPIPVQMSKNDTEYLSRLVCRADPDLIVITGDMNSNAINSMVIEGFIEYFDLLGVPYAVVFGNHDAEGRATKAKLAEIISSGSNSLFQYGPSSITGMGNYVINVNNSAGDIAWSLFMMDSNMYDEDGEYDYIHSDQQAWYEWNVNALKAANGGSLDSMAFFHIPLPEYGEAYDAVQSGGAELMFGERREAECPPIYNSGFFEKMKTLDSTRAVFAGHDHINDYSVMYQGIRLTYGVKTTTHGYNEERLSGGLLITLSDGGYTLEQILME